MKRLMCAVLVAGVAVLVVLSVMGCGGGSGQMLTDQNGRLLGSWGARSSGTQMVLSSIGGEFNDLIGCGWGGPIDGPVIPDASGHFSVGGAYTSRGNTIPVHYVGVVRGGTMTVDVVPDASGTALYHYTLIYGQQPGQTAGGCPG